jgi:FeS assembly SUF system protein
MTPDKPAPAPAPDPARDTQNPLPPRSEAPPAPPPAATPDPLATGADPFCSPPADLNEAVIDALSTCYDPEIPVNIYDLGLIYGIDITPENAVTIRMTLTSPACPVAGTLPPEVEQKVRAIPGVSSAKVDLVWEPPWGKHLLSEAARLQLGMDGY